MAEQGHTKPVKRGMFSVVPGQHQPKPVRNGAIFLVLIVALLYMGYTKNIPFINEGATKLRAQVDNSVNIFPGNEVRVHGVKVGKVTGVERAADKGAIIEMDITDDDVNIKRDARADVYWRTLLGGNFYVELSPGSPSAAKMPDDGLIPLNRTSSQVEFDQLLTTFDEPGRQGIKTFFREFQKGFQGDDAGKAIERFGPAARALAPGMRAVRGLQPGADIPKLVTTASKALGAASKSESDLAGIIDGGNRTLAVTAARQADIGSMLDQAPGTFDDTRVTLARLRTTLDILDPTANKLRPGVRRLDSTVERTRPAMRAIRDFVPDAMPVLRDADPAVRQLASASRSATPLMNELAPTLDRFTNEINPWLDSRAPNTKLKTSWGIGPFFAVIGTSASNYDANGFAQNFDTAVGLGDTLSQAVDCSKFGVGAAGCEVLLKTLGEALGAGPTAQGAP